MADITVDTTVTAYTVRRQQFADIRGFYGPRLRAYYDIRDRGMQKAVRQADPFLRDILDFVRKCSEHQAKDVE